MSAPGYYRFPSIHRDRIAFICEDDLWEVELSGGRARRLTAGEGRVMDPAYSPNGEQLAYVGGDEGFQEVYVMPAAGGPARRLSYLGARCLNTGWSPDGQVVFASNAGLPFGGLFQLRAVSSEGGEVSILDTGPAMSVSFGAAGGRVIGRHTSDIARWKRYRGGLTGDLWIDAAGDGQWRRLVDLEGNVARPLWLGERIYFVSDHEGIGNLYSCRPEGDDLRRHTEHGDFYVRHPASDGQRIVYHAGADLFVFDPETDESQVVPVALGSPRHQRRRRFVEAADYLQGYDLHPDGHSLALVSRGKPFSFGNWAGAVEQHGQEQGVRHRLATWLRDGRRLAWVSDAAGEESIEIAEAGPGASAQTRRLEGLDLGRPLEMAASPQADLLALSNHRHELILVDLESGEQRRLERSAHEPPQGLAWSPDGAWLAYGLADSAQTSRIQLCRIEDGATFPATRPVLRDFQPAWDPEGRYLYFLSSREFDPVYDGLHFDLGFPFGVRPYLVTLQADLPSPFVRQPKDLARPADEPEGDEPNADEQGLEESDAEVSEEQAEEYDADPASDEDAADADDDSETPGPIHIDLEGLSRRVLAFPVEEGHYGQVAGVKGKVLYTEFPVEGSLRPSAAAKLGAGVLLSFDLSSLEESTLVEDVSDFSLSMDGKHLVYRDGPRLRVLGVDGKPDKSRMPGPKSGWLDLGRVQVLVEPAAEWRQMYREAWRMQRDQFWSADMSGVDWQRIYQRYLPLIERVATRDEFSDLMWEMQGELGTSHAYEYGGDYRPEPSFALGFLGADLRYDAERGGYAVERVAQGDVWDERAGSPLAKPGVDVQPGDLLLAVDGRSVGQTATPEERLLRRAGRMVSLTFAAREPDPEPTDSEATEADAAPSDGEAAGPRSITVKALADERPLRYRDWVEDNRSAVHSASKGRVGYLHVPDMGARGFAEFHRGYLAELVREGLIVDLRFNGGGHVSPLLLEKLARKRLGYDVQRWGQPLPYPPESPLGPIVALTNEQAGSDGDVFSHAFKLMGLGPLIGTRTWGGVVGIRQRQPFVDGGRTTQPELSIWFFDQGFGLENRGTEPDIKVEIRPQDHVAGRDPQLERAIEEIERLMAEDPPRLPEFGERPSRSLPELPPGNGESRSA